ncbi:MAG TPA: hypothetical protein VER17_04475 [Tepidisphaeraceae bacterium]|nr:hypothetical protein [Tepidisphaeraceae bacterium]
MSTEAAPREASTLAAIFQKAYARAVALQRLDEQISALLDQRQKLESDFREAQAEVNQECERMLTCSSIAPAKLLAQLAESGAAVDPHLVAGGNGRLARVKPAGVR